MYSPAPKETDGTCNQREIHQSPACICKAACLHVLRQAVARCSGSGASRRSPSAAAAFAPPGYPRLSYALLEPLPLSSNHNNLSVSETSRNARSEMWWVIDCLCALLCLHEALSNEPSVPVMSRCRREEEEASGSTPIGDSANEMLGAETNETDCVGTGSLQAPINLSETMR